MKIQKTVKIKIGKLSKNKQIILNNLLSKNTKAINFCLQKAKEGQIISHSLVYKDLRKLNIPATVIHGCRAKSIEIIKSYKKRKGKKTFPKLQNSCIRYDNQVIKLRKTDNKLYEYFISLLYEAGVKGKSNNRIELPLIVNSEYQKEIIQKIGRDYKLGSTELIKKNDSYFVCISYSKEVAIPSPDGSFSPIAVDVGINNLAVSVTQSKVTFYSGKKMNWKNEFYRRQKDRLQKNFALQEIKRLKGRQTRYNNSYIHNIAKRIVEQAKQEEKPVVILEDLKYIRETTKVTKKQRVKHHSWIFRRLQNAIEHKANWVGIPVVYIDPSYSSQICSKCGGKNKRNKHVYKCENCGYESNADYNAARNLQHIFKAKCFGEQASINNASNEIKPEPKAEKDDIVGKFQEQKERRDILWETNR
ncbi:IS200/IS605 family element transposase accessory protein TnpB [Candidatus Woesearchaeota archaeon]|nr:IS200/IS605 family element transposase accessory protein TnpB [Candidatus Woesearchaeota archaeon]